MQLYPAVAEEVTEIYFKAGDKVQEGVVLVQLDGREEQFGRSIDGSETQRRTEFTATL